MNDWAPFSAVAIFAEDARDEIAGTVSLIGIMPDNILVDSFPALLPRLQLYIRISYDPSDPPRDVSSGLRVDDLDPVMTQRFDPRALKLTIAEAARSGARIGTIIARFGAANVQLNGPCLLNGTITWNDEEYIVGTLAVKARG